MKITIKVLLFIKNSFLYISNQSWHLVLVAISTTLAFMMMSISVWVLVKVNNIPVETVLNFVDTVIHSFNNSITNRF